ncbi:MAG: PorT family protein [Balneolaceae bacterium]|nr:PorT family protein [Balneolaceae bacterium]
MRNTKTLLALAFFVFAFFTGRTEAQHTEWGLRGGLNMTNIYDTDFNPEPHVGFQAGLYLTHWFDKSSFAIQPEVLYTRKGFEKNTYRINYIEVPVLARFNFNRDVKQQPYIYLGPYAGIKVNADTPPVVIHSGYITAPEGPSSNYSFTEGDINPVDFGIIVGGGFDFGRFDIGLRYSGGLRDISDDENTSAKHSVLSITAGAAF